jgi:hypothetical protein
MTEDILRCCDLLFRLAFASFVLLNFDDAPLDPLKFFTVQADGNDRPIAVT